MEEIQLHQLHSTLLTYEKEVALLKGRLNDERTARRQLAKRTEYNVNMVKLEAASERSAYQQTQIGLESISAVRYSPFILLTLVFSAVGREGEASRRGGKSIA